MEAERRRIAEALPGYEVGEEIGRGAWGVVYAGRHRHLGRDVAIKQLPAAFGADPALRARFSSEARLVASLDHPHIVPVYDYVESEGLYLIVMEHLPGGTLWERFNQQGVGLDEAVAVILAACAALGYAHQRDILHRDVKPDNLLLGGAGAPKLTDFGIAKLLTSTRTALTAAGTVVGTPAYMAPEQARGGTISPATDVYACAVMLYELLAGTLPFPEASDPTAQLYQHVHQEPRHLGQMAPAVPAGLCDVVMRALAKAPTDRYESAEELGVAAARAATTAWGPGWVHRTEITVMDHGRISAAIQQPADSVRGPAASTVIVRGTGIDHPVLEPVARDSTPPPAPSSGAELSLDDQREVAGLAAQVDQQPEPALAPPGGPTVLPRWSGPNGSDGSSNNGNRRWLAALGVSGVVLVAALAFVLTRDAGGDPDDIETSQDPTTTAPTTPTTPDTTGPETTTTTEPPLPDGRFAQIDEVQVQDGYYVVDYTAYDFEPLIDDTDPNQYHVHFFWNIYEPAQAGTNAADYGVEQGSWELWDAPVFDAFAVADRPPEAGQICAVVATYDHQVDNPDNYSCAQLPDAAG